MFNPLVALTTSNCTVNTLELHVTKPKGGKGRWEGFSPSIGQHLAQLRLMSDRARGLDRSGQKRHENSNETFSWSSLQIKKIQVLNYNYNKLDLLTAP